MCVLTIASFDTIHPRVLVALVSQVSTHAVPSTTTSATTETTGFLDGTAFRAYEDGCRRGCLSGVDADFYNRLRKFCGGSVKGITLGVWMVLCLNVFIMLPSTD